MNSYKLNTFGPQLQKILSEAGAAADGGATEGSWGDGVPGKKCKREVFDILACISDS